MRYAPTTAPYRAFGEQERARLADPEDGALELEFALTCHPVRAYLPSAIGQTRAAFDLVARTAGDPAILGMSNHLLYSGKRSA